jgi:hypothetical protein
MGIGDAAHLAANSLDQLGTALSYLRPDRSGYITAEEYERITGEEFYQGPQDDCESGGPEQVYDSSAAD